MQYDFYFKNVAFSHNTATVIALNQHYSIFPLSEPLDILN